MYKIIFDKEPAMSRQALDAEITRLEKLLKSNLQLQMADDDFKARHKLKAALAAGDYAERGCIDRASFDRSMQSLNMILPAQVATYWFSQYPWRGDDTRFDYVLFAETLFGRTNAPARDPECRKAVEIARQKLLERGLPTMHGLTRSFRGMDKDRNGKLSSAEFREGLQRYGVTFDDATFAKVIKGFDRDGDGISVTEFLTTLRGPLNDRRRQLVELAFRQLDRDRSGVVEFGEIASIYDASRHPEVLAKRRSIEDVLLEFIHAWDRDGDGQISLVEFMDYYKDISSSIDNDDYFELMIRNAWHLAGGQGWCANTSNLRVLVVHSDGTEEVVCVANDLGLDKKNTAAVRAVLEDQGVSDIQRIALAF